MMFHVLGPAGGDVVAVGSEIGSEESLRRRPPYRRTGGADVISAGSHVANAGFMVSPTAAGWGVGRARPASSRSDAEDGNAAMQFNAVVETNEPAGRLWQSLGFTILATVSEAFLHPDRGLISLHIMHRFLRNQRSDRPWFRGRRTNTIPCAPDSLGFSQSHETSSVDFRSKDPILVLMAGPQSARGLRTEVRT
jgi:hypothetical protein